MKKDNRAVVELASLLERKLIDFNLNRNIAWGKFIFLTSCSSSMWLLCSLPWGAKRRMHTFAFYSPFKLSHFIRSLPGRNFKSKDFAAFVFNLCAYAWNPLL
jgi:hypothetical protein